jgi:hypothetical protein
MSKCRHGIFRQTGGVAERLKAAVLKTVVGVTLPWVRIPPPPPFFIGCVIENGVNPESARAHTRRI